MDKQIGQDSSLASRINSLFMLLGNRSPTFDLCDKIIFIYMHFLNWLFVLALALPPLLLLLLSPSPCLGSTCGCCWGCAHDESDSEDGTDLLYLRPGDLPIGPGDGLLAQSAEQIKNAIGSGVGNNGLPNRMQNS